MVLSLLQLQSVRTALESKASNDQMSELKGVLSEVDKLVSNRLMTRWRKDGCQSVGKAPYELFRALGIA
jgi:hypothetical protein